MRYTTLLTAALLGALTTVPGAAAARADAPVAQRDHALSPPGRKEAPADSLQSALDPPRLRRLAEEVLERNPEVAVLATTARAAEQVAPQVRSLADPMAALTAYLLTPETRVGPQRVMASLSQRFPWFGTLALREQAALYAAVAARARLEARRLELVTETRRLYFEIGFLDAWNEATRLDRETLIHYEELARARYASGVGLEQAVVKIQAEITRDDSRLLDIATRRAVRVAELNALRDLPQTTPVPTVELPPGAGASLDRDALRAAALGSRPEIAAAEADIERARTVAELARKRYYPDVTVGLTYGLVTDRGDRPGRSNPPADNGQDVLGVSGAVNLPIWREKLAAGVEEATSRRLAAEEARRVIVTRIDSDLGDLLQRLPLTWQQLRLFEDVLIIQAEQALRSAEAAYAAGAADALDLLDAERVLLEVRTATARARADYAVALARLEGVLGSPLAAAASLPNGETDE